MARGRPGMAAAALRGVIAGLALMLASAAPAAEPDSVTIPVRQRPTATTPT